MVSLKKINPAPNKICSIDASTNSMAFAIFEDEKLVANGKINFSGFDTYHRLGDAVRKIRSFFERYRDVDAIVIEHTVYMNSAKTVSDLALVQGAILSGIVLNSIDTIKSINPIAWQSFLGNNRLTEAEKANLRASSPGKSASWHKNNEREFRKQRTIDLVNKIYDKNISDNDIADAVGVGHYAIHNWFKLG